jgi:hypothetical protein
VSGPEHIMLTFFSSKKSAQPSLLSQSRKGLRPRSQEFVSISLMADIPDNGLNRGFEDRMQSNGKLHCPQTRSQVAPVASGRGNNLRSEIICELFEISREI